MGGDRSLSAPSRVSRKLALLQINTRKILLLGRNYVGVCSWLGEDALSGRVGFETQATYGYDAKQKQIGSAREFESERRCARDLNNPSVCLCRQL